MKTFDEFHAIGVMSGTSLDGLDISYSIFRINEGHWTGEIISATTITYEEDLKNKLTNINKASALEFSKFNIAFGNWIGEKVDAYIKTHGLKIDVIGSHGHTVFHQPENKLTVQIGDGNAIWGKCQLPVVCDFRTVDVLLGGQGAPLVPIGDKLLYHNYDACLNLGGIANISLTNDHGYQAFDICPVNTALNKYAQELGFSYDDKGHMAKSGSVQPVLLDRLNALPYYQQAPPKSLGREWIETEFIPLIDKQYEAKDILATLTDHIAEQLSSVIAKTFKKEKKTPKVLITGGGAHNEFLIEQIALKLSERVQCVIPPSMLIEHKESQIFALLGVLRLLNLPSNISSVTGSSKEVSLGVLYDFQ